MADIETTVSPPSDLLVLPGLKLRNAAKGVLFDTSVSISGAVGNLDFATQPILRMTVTGNLTGAFNWPPINYPPLESDNQSVILTVAFFQDETGGRAIDLDALFVNAGVDNIFGVALVTDSPGGVTTVDIIARRTSGTTTWEVFFSPVLDGSQIWFGTIGTNVLPVATISTPGILAIASGSGAAAAGNHIHATPLASKITIESNGAAITSGDYELLDMPTGFTITRLTGFQLTGTGTPTATITAKISGTSVTGTGTAANSTSASADANATAANTGVARQKILLNVAITAGTVVMVAGYMHYTVNTEVWTG